jgi:dipeptide/tripeptide permease
MRAFFFGSMLAPALIASCIKRIHENSGFDIITLSLLASSSILFLLPLLLIKGIRKTRERVKIKATKIESNEWIMILACISYLIPLWRDLGPENIACIVFIASIILTTLESIPYHPTLHLFKYKFYKAEISGKSVTIITKGPKQSPNEINEVHIISTSLYIEA